MLLIIIIVIAFYYSDVLSVDIKISVTVMRWFSLHNWPWNLFWNFKNFFVEGYRFFILCVANIIIPWTPRTFSEMSIVTNDIQHIVMARKHRALRGLTWVSGPPCGRGVGERMGILPQKPDTQIIRGLPSVTEVACKYCRISGFQRLSMFGQTKYGKWLKRGKAAVFADFTEGAGEL